MMFGHTKTKSHNDLFHNQLNTLYGVETESKATPEKMAKAATSPAVRKELEAAAHETTTHVKRLDDVFASIGEKPHAIKCGCIGGLMDDCSASASIEADANVRDAAMVAMAQTIQHNEISRYGAAHGWAQSLKQDKASMLLKQTLDEETASRTRLSDLAKTVNTSAMHKQRDGSVASSRSRRRPCRHVVMDVLVVPRCRARAEEPRRWVRVPIGEVSA